MEKLGNEVTKNFAKEVAKEALGEYKLDIEKDRKKRIFRNTKVLLKHYNDLNSHIDNAVWKNKLDYDDPIDLMSNLKEEIIIHSVKKTQARTMMMIAHIDAALHELKEKHAGQPDKYLVINRLYLDKKLIDKTAAEKQQIVAEEICTTARNIRRYETEMIKDLSIFLYGVGAVELIK